MDCNRGLAWWSPAACKGTNEVAAITLVAVGDPSPILSGGSGPFQGVWVRGVLKLGRGREVSLVTGLGFVVDAERHESLPA